jgi:glucose/arabinose dehydrogenase
VRARPLLLAVLILVLVAGGCGDDASPDAPPAESPSSPHEPTESSPDPRSPTETDDGPRELQVETVATGLVAPWDVAFLPDGRVWVTERDSGLLKAVDGEGAVTEVRSFNVDATGEGGLMGLAVSPMFDDDGWVYAYYTAADDSRVVRFRGEGIEEPVLTGIPKARNHNGGRIAFGPDGKLYVGTGDALQPGSAQDVDSLAGKVLRLEPDGGVPDDNPVPGSPVWSLGHRNVQGLAWDADDRLYVTELGPERDDEINRVEPGANYGWPEVTGMAGQPGFVDPIAVFQPPESSPSGAVVVTGEEAGDWEGSLVLANLRGQRLWRLELTEDGMVAGQEELFVSEYGRLRHVTLAPDGSLWMMTSNRDGRGRPAPEDDRILRVLPPRS